MPVILVLCWGNPLRRDDGAAWAVAESVRARLGRAGAEPHSVQIVTAHQLLPEHAVWVAGSEVVLFVDAEVPRTRHGVPCWRRVQTEGVAPAAGSITHFLSPTGLVAWARTLYGRAPRDVYLVSIPAFDLGHGEGLSARTHAAARRAAAQVVALVRRRTGGPDGRKVPGPAAPHSVAGGRCGSLLTRVIAGESSISRTWRWKAGSSPACSAAPVPRPGNSPRAGPEPRPAGIPDLLPDG